MVPGEPVKILCDDGTVITRKGGRTAGECLAFEVEKMEEDRYIRRNKAALLEGKLLVRDLNYTPLLRNVPINRIYHD